MKLLTERFFIFLLSLIFVICLPNGRAAAENPQMKAAVLPSPPQNQTMTDNLITDIYGTPTSTATSSTAGYFIDSYVGKQNAIRASYLNTAKAYEHAYSVSGKEKAFQRMIKAENAASAANLKGMGANLTGKLYGGYCLYSDIASYNDKSKHRHSSLAFLDQSLRGFNITAGALDNGGMKLAKPLAIGGGIMKDFVGGNVFSDWANRQDNIVLEYSDWVVDNMNEYTYNAMLYYIELFNHTDDANVYGRPPYGTGVYKPNIYLYPSEGSMVTVSFEFPSLLTSSIPLYQGRWQVMADTGGALTDTSTGLEYQYLFYESITDPALFTYDKGFVIQSGSREEQFSDILYQYGFNQKESEDFVCYWNSKLEAGTDYIMYPQLTEAVDLAMPLKVSPAPSSSFRLWFAFKALNGTSAVKMLEAPDTPEIQPICRDGFTLVEWGGYILSY